MKRDRKPSCVYSSTLTLIILYCFPLPFLSLSRAQVHGASGPPCGHWWSARAVVGAAGDVCLHSDKRLRHRGEGRMAVREKGKRDG